MTEPRYDFKTLSDTRKYEYIDFGYRDRWGRKMGASIRTYIMMAFTQQPDSERRGYDWSNDVDSHGRYFAVYMQTTRENAEYGATQATRYFKTFDDRKQYIDKRLKAMKKRAEKHHCDRYDKPK